MGVYCWPLIVQMVSSAVKQLPKVELHLHLEGAIPIRTFLSLIEKYDKDSDIKTKEQLAQKLTFTDFTHFISCWQWMCTLLRSPDDFEELTFDVLSDLHSQNVKYAELIFSSSRYWERDGKVIDKK